MQTTSTAKSSRQYLPRIVVTIVRVDRVERVNFSARQADSAWALMMSAGVDPEIISASHRVVAAQAKAVR